MMLTRCPSCQASFRASSEQLSARAGWVRCGKCKTPFNALENLLDDSGQPMILPEMADDGLSSQPVQQPATPSAPPGSPVSASRRTPVSPPTQSEPPVSRTRRSAPASSGREMKEPVFREPSLDERDEPPLSGVAAERAHAIAEAAASAGFSTGHHASSPPVFVLEEKHTRDVGRNEPFIALSEPKAATQRITATDDPLPEWRDAAVHAPDSWHYEDEEPVGKSTWLWWALSMPLLILLCVQSVILFREPVARWRPEIRPILEAACKTLGYSIPLPREATYIGVEASDLHPEPGKPNAYVLATTLRNRAAFPQALPYLEITLTDAQDRALVRRVLAPKEWLPDESKSLEQFKPNTILLVRLPFAAPTISPVGYRIYAFYP